LTILNERIHRLFGKFSILGQLAILPACQPFVGANPKTPVMCGYQASNVVARETFAFNLVPWDVPNAIEAKQAEFRA
jgi:hypothetical protein